MSCIIVVGSFLSCISVAGWFLSCIREVSELYPAVSCHSRVEYFGCFFFGMVDVDH